MTLFTRAALTELAADQQPPCLSLYQPTHRHHPDNQQDPIRFGNLVRQLEESLRRGYPAAEARQLLRPFEILADDAEFWRHTLDGLAVLSAPGLSRVYTLQRAVPELADVADTFHTKPLRRFLQSVDRYEILGLSQREVRFFEGNRDVLDEVDLAPGVPHTITEALGDQLTEPHQSVRSFTGGAGGGASVFHGHGGRSDEMQVDRERFFRVVDRAILEHHSRPSGLPLLLAALAEHQGAFRQISQNPFLVPEGIALNPEAVSLDELRDLAWQRFEPQYQARIEALADDYRAARGNGLGSDDLEQVAQAAVAGRVATLLVQAGHQAPGRLDAATGRVTAGSLDDPRIGDLLDDLGELVEAMGGQVMVVPPERLSLPTGLAATYRY
ncbi:MAG: baeRF3 domain-containing protein [Chloroflexota bacterium]